jgi:hypothetical protein
MNSRHARRVSPESHEAPAIRPVSAWLEPVPPPGGGGGIMLAVGLSALAWLGLATILLD